jgi:hypothetical protein
MAATTMDQPISPGALMRRLVTEQRENAKAAQLAIAAACSAVELAIAALADGLPADARPRAIASLNEQAAGLLKMKRVCDAWATQAEKLAASTYQRTRKES